MNKEQFDLISLEINEINADINNLKKGILTAGPRLKRLHDSGFHIETVTLNGQLIEHSIVMALRTFESKRRMLKILGQFDPFSKIELGDYEEQTMGNLIKLLTKFTGESELIAQLWNFKNKYRDEFIHRIFDGTKDIAQMDREADDYFKTKEFQKMIIGLSNVTNKAKSEAEALYASSKN